MQRQSRLPSVATAVVAFAGLVSAQSIVQGPSSSRSPYLRPYAPPGVVRFVASIVTATDLVPLTGAPSQAYELPGIIDGLGCLDNGDGTVTVIACHEINTNQGVVRRHGAIGALLSETIVDKHTLAVVSARDLITEVVEANGTVRSPANGNPVAMGRFCSGDLPPVSALYNTATGLGTQERIFFCGEEFAGASWLLATVVTGAEKGRAYVLPAFNLATNGSGINAVGSWENALANPFPQDLTLVVATNDGGSGVQNNRVSVYYGLKQATGNPVERAGLKSGQSFFVSVVGNPVEIVNNTTRATNITTGTRFTLHPTAGTQFSRPEDGHWDPLNPRDFYFVTTDRLDTATSTGRNQTIGASGPANQRGMSRLWRLRFDDIADPAAGGEIALLIDGSKSGYKVNMLDNMCVGADGMVYLTEDPGNTTYLGKTWAYDPATDTLVPLLQFDPARWGDLAVNGGTPGAVSPHTNDKEISGVIDVTDLFPHDPDEVVLLIDAQDHSTNPGVATPASVEGGQLLLVKVSLRARTEPFGVGCGLTLAAAVGSLPVLGSPLLADLDLIPAGAPAFMMVGLSNTWFAGVPLPLALDPLGLPGCVLYQDLALEGMGVCAAIGPNTARYTLPIPSHSAFTGFVCYLQGFAFDATANPGGMVGSNALSVKLGL